MSNTLYLPVSVGEAFDKLSILEIKCDKIKDERKIEVKKEYDMLKNELREIIKHNNKLYVLLKKINLLIFDEMDLLRDNKPKTNDEFIFIFKKSLESNDIRFKIKNKINLALNSCLKEQKTYNITSFTIEINCSDDIVHYFFKPIKYLSCVYNKVIILSKNNVEKLKSEFNDDLTVDYNQYTTNINLTFNDDHYEEEYIEKYFGDSYVYYRNLFSDETS